MLSYYYSTLQKQRIEQRKLSFRIIYIRAVASSLRLGGGWGGGAEGGEQQKST
jgi:hypothetical protein